MPALALESGSPLETNSHASIPPVGTANEMEPTEQTDPAEPREQTEPTEQTEQTPHTQRLESGTRQENGYLYDSFPVYNTRRARLGAPNDKPRIAAGGKSGGARVLAPDLTRGLLMMIMALDHVSLFLHTWQHGTGRVPEADGHVITSWNFTTAYIVRTLTHLCAPGFTFLLGMGVVYLGRSRTNLGWGHARLARYFAVRCAVLTIVTGVLGFVVTGGQVYFMNAVLFALAVDYLLAGLLWLAMEKTEASLARFLRILITTRKSWLLGSSPEPAAEAADDESIMQPLLRERPEADASYEASVSWGIHNAVLLALSAVTIFWNAWLSDGGGKCKSSVSAAVTSPAHPLLRIWFWVLEQPGSRVASNFPPMAWLSFAILGILYGRIITARSWTRQAVVLAHVSAALFFAILFVLTRVLQFGNLSTGCLQTPDQDAHPLRNPYLASPASFFYIVKYPPDLAFLAFTMAAILLIQAGFTAVPPHIAKRMSMLLDFGTSALFFYVAHMLIVLLLGAVVVALFGHDTGLPGPMNPDDTRGVDNLFGYFGFWALMMLVMWPACAWYSRFKSTRGADSIWRFF
ncbi:hypothetical protein E4U42_000855 [Claviceps africana]|uniref:Heparan-alpha-glucosaminide N-acetyltransferase catalytic domain-containing protein n=1 Tax=Claviceps africana TaxID=83212 RepID=A0A8K0JB56_9HYPO|nr:hypothetical protein E4U42_000855 [Claviceps africana]